MSARSAGVAAPEPARGAAPGPSPAELTAAATAGDRRAVARLLSLVEDGALPGTGTRVLREVSALLAPHTGRARVIGLTGAPGVGKSTSTSALVAEYRARGLRVGVLAVDPSSPFTGGALLGDRVRMAEHATDTGVFVRSLATRGSLGGLSWATPQALRVLDAAGYDVVFVETVGVGQAEVDVAALADTTVVLVAPGMGDGIQAAKAGIMEVADVLVVNKADRPGADHTYRDLLAAVRMTAGGASRPATAPRPDKPDPSHERGLSGEWGSSGERDSSGEPAPGAAGRWPAVVRLAAVTRHGLPDLVAAIDGHHAWLRAGGELDRRRRRRAAEEIAQIALAGLRARLGEIGGAATLDRLARAVVAGRLDPYRAADELTEAAGGLHTPS